VGHRCNTCCSCCLRLLIDSTDAREREGKRCRLKERQKKNKERILQLLTSGRAHRALVTLPTVLRHNIQHSGRISRYLGGPGCDPQQAAFDDLGLRQLEATSGCMCHTHVLPRPPMRGPRRSAQRIGSRTSRHNFGSGCEGT